MADVLGIASSITALIGSVVTVIRYIEAVKNAPKERDQLLRELQYLEIYLPPIEKLILLSSEDDPWLATLQQSHGRFKEISVLLEGLKKKLEAELTKGRRLCWPFTKESVADDLNKIERFKTTIIFTGLYKTL